MRAAHSCFLYFFFFKISNHTWIYTQVETKNAIYTAKLKRGKCRDLLWSFSKPARLDRLALSAVSKCGVSLEKGGLLGIPEGQNVFVNSKITFRALLFPLRWHGLVC